MSANPTAAVIDCRNVWKVFASDTGIAEEVIRQRIDKDRALSEVNAVVAVRDATFSVQRGEVFCIMGLSGSGKSTLVRHINRLIEPSAGQILINGEDISGLSQPKLRELRAKHIGMVFQNMALLPHRDVRDNVAFGLELQGVSPEQRKQTAEKTLSMVHLEGWGDRFPNELSGGMQQRVGLARALSADPEILLMDEPFSALDPLIRRQLQDQFLELSSIMKKTTVFITHDLDEAIRLGDRIAIMKDGALVQIGSPEEIVLHPVDEYVTDFVRGISKLTLIRAHSIMTGIESSLDLTNCPMVDKYCDLKALLDLAVHSDNPTIVVDEEQNPVGHISRQRLLEAVREYG